MSVVKMRNKSLKILKQYSVLFLIAGVLLSVKVYLELKLPLIIKSLSKYSALNSGIIMRIILYLLLVALGIEVLHYISDYIFCKISNAITINIQQETINNIVQTDYENFKKYEKGEIINRLTKDVDAIEQIIHQIIPCTFQSLLYIFFAVIILFSMNSVLAILSLSMIGIYLLSFSILNKRIIKKYRTNITKFDNLMDNVQDIVNSTKDIKMYSIIQKTLTFFKKIQVEFYNNNLKLSLFITFTKRWYDFIKIVANILVIVVGFYLVSARQLDYGTLFAFILYINSLYTPVVDLFDSLNDFNKCKENLKRIFEFSKYNECINNSEPWEFDKIQSIEFRNLTFAYNEEPVLQNINILFEKGKSYALVGQTGSGKSTLLNIIMGLYTPVSGDILINEKPVSYALYKNINKHAYCIFQDSYLLNQTLEDNIMLFNNLSSDNMDVVKLKLKKAQLTELLDRRKEKIGNNGRNLSGGQKQRLFITRIFNKPKDLIVLDEITSELDKDTEKNVLDNIFKEYRKSILIMCSHQQQVLDYVTHVINIENKTLNLIR